MEAAYSGGRYGPALRIRRGGKYRKLTGAAVESILQSSPSFGQSISKKICRVCDNKESELQGHTSRLRLQRYSSHLQGRRWNQFFNLPPTSKIKQATRLPRTMLLLLLL
jgi:hypothetical protein